MDKYARFLLALNKSARKNKEELTSIIGNILSMRDVGAKTHGDIAEIVMTEYINRYVSEYRAIHVGKERFRSKTHEEDIIVISSNGEEIAISLKMYGHGPLQLSTDKDSTCFQQLKYLKGKVSREFVSNLMPDQKNGITLPIIYDEKSSQFNIMIFNMNRALSETKKVRLVKEGRGRKHPVFLFEGEAGYIMEVRYGSKRSNAFQRGIWTHTKNAQQFFLSVTNGWLPVKKNEDIIESLVEIFMSSNNVSNT